MGLNLHHRSFGASFNTDFSWGGSTFRPSLGMSAPQRQQGVTRSGITGPVNGVQQNGSPVTVDREAALAAYGTATLYRAEGGLSLADFNALPAVMAERQEAAAMFGVDAFKTVGDISGAMGWQEGSLPKVLLHGAVGAATARLGGGNPGVGAVVGAANELVIPTMDQLAQRAGLTKGSAAYENALRLGSLALGGAVGGLIGGDALSSGGIATTATENNYLKHAELLQYGQALDKCRNDKDAKACEAVNRWDGSPGSGMRHC